MVEETSREAQAEWVQERHTLEFRTREGRRGTLTTALGPLAGGEGRWRLKVSRGFVSESLSPPESGRLLLREMVATYYGDFPDKGEAQAAMRSVLERHAEFVGLLDAERDLLTPPKPGSLVGEPDGAWAETPRPPEEAR